MHQHWLALNVSPSVSLRSNLPAESHEKGMVLIVDQGTCETINQGDRLGHLAPPMCWIMAPDGDTSRGPSIPYFTAMALANKSLDAP